jgi:DAK2 domain fusion protein YloV
MLQALDATQVRRWAVACVQSLDAHREAIDSINVYPVPDGDTGSNLLHTMRAALDALLRAPARARTDAGAAVAVLARGALTGARGNSGVIVSQFLRGVADALADLGTVLGPGLRTALSRGAERAGAAMAEPVAGTMLTVLEAAARAARAESSDALQDVAAAAATAAAAALDQTPSQLAVLADAGVVDAGGRGVVVLLDALYAVVTGRPAALAAAQRATAERTTRRSADGQENPLYTSRESGSDAFAYEVMYLLEQVGEPAGPLVTGPGHARDGHSVVAVDHLRDVLVGLGDSVSVVGDGAGLWTVHVHTNDIGAAIEAGIDAGRPRQIRVARFADAAPPEASRFVRDRAVVVPSRSSEFADLLISEGVTVVLLEAGNTEADGTKWQADGTKPETDGTETDGTETDGTETDGTETDGTETDGTETDGTETDGTGAGGTETDGTGVGSTGASGTGVGGTGTGTGGGTGADRAEADGSLAYLLLETISGTGAAHVTVLPADARLVEAADEASIRAIAAGQDVVVVPCASPVQVLAAVAVHDPRRRAGDDVVAMAEAAAATRRGEVVVATEAAITWIGACDAGDVLGFADGEVVLIEPGPADVAALDRAACGVVERMLTVGGELVTALVGADAPDELAVELEDFLRREHPETELVVYQGGQHNAVLVLGVE